MHLVTHLQFVDDTLFFCELVCQELLGYEAILRCFELVSGLRINLGKSTIIEINLAENLLKDLAEGMGCGIGTVPFTYLRLPVGGNPRHNILVSGYRKSGKKTDWVGEKVSLLVGVLPSLNLL